MHAVQHWPSDPTYHRRASSFSCIPFPKNKDPGAEGLGGWGGGGAMRFWPFPTRFTPFALAFTSHHQPGSADGGGLDRPAAVPTTPLQKRFKPLNSLSRGQAKDWVYRVRLKFLWKPRFAPNTHSRRPRVFTATKHDCLGATGDLGNLLKHKVVRLGYISNVGALF